MDLDDMPEARDWNACTQAWYGSHRWDERVLAALLEQLLAADELASSE